MFQYLSSLKNKTSVKDKLNNKKDFIQDCYNREIEFKSIEEISSPGVS